ncbi:MAG: hypothetical protein RCO49_01805 [Rickettsia endosymbiont of Argas persicus]
MSNIKLLLSQGADIEALDAQGKKPIDYATNQEIKDLLKESARHRQVK